MTDRIATLKKAIAYMQKALEQLDSVQAYVPAAKLQHAIDIVVEEAKPQPKAPAVRA